MSAVEGRTEVRIAGPDFRLGTRNGPDNPSAERKRFCVPKSRADIRPASLISLAPTVLPRDTDSAELASCASRNAGAGRKLQRVLSVDRKGEGEASPRVRLLVVTLYAVERRAAAGEIEPVQRHPYAGLERVDGVSLHRIDQRL